MKKIRIVLVEPAGARNVGSVARVMANMGLGELILVAPRCDWQGEEAKQMAVHAPHLLAKARVVADLPAGLVGCERVVATTHRCQDLPLAPQDPAEALAWLRSTSGPGALIFGREDRGLTNGELNLAQRYLRIPVDEAYTSLNLAQAVGICAYELRRSGSRSPLAPQDGETLAPVEQLDRFMAQLETLLLEVGYLYPHTATSRMAKLRRLCHRANLSTAEMALLWGMVGQVNWYCNAGQRPDHKN